MKPLSGFLAAGLLGACLGIPPSAHGQTERFPSRPITLVVPFATGGGVDAVARIVAPVLQETLGQPVVIENVPGGGGLIGTERVIRSRPDGHTLLMTTGSPITFAPVLSPAAVRYDALTALTPLSSFVEGTFVLLGRSGLKARDTAELLRIARQGAPLSYATDGVAGAPHLAAELIQQHAGIRLTHVPYKSGAQALADLTAGHIDLAVLSLALARPAIQGERVTVYGTTGRDAGAETTRLPRLADTPALRQLDIGYWIGFFAPSGIQRDTAETLVQAIGAMAASPRVQARLRDLDLSPSLRDPGSFRTFLAQERLLLQSVVEKTGLQAK